MLPLKYGDGPVICLSVNMGSHALKVHGLADDTSQLTLEQLQCLIHACVCLTDSIPGESVTTAVTIMELEGGSVAIKMIIK